MPRKTSKDKIIKAAVSVFAEKGFDLATMDEIAKKSELSKGTIFLYFKKKDELIKQIAMLSIPYDVVEETLSGKYESAEEMLYEFGKKFMDKYKDSEMRSLLMMTISNKKRYKIIESKLKSVCIDKFDEFFKKVEKLSGVEIPFTLRRSFFGALLCYLIWWEDNPLDPEEYVRQLSKTILMSLPQESKEKTHNLNRE